MQTAPATTAGTVAQQGSAFPPFDTATYPSQLFWLAITFAVLLVVLWRIAGPRIGAVIGERKGRIAGDLGAAEQHRKSAEAAEASYQSALASARARAQKGAEENRKHITDEVEKAKAAAESEAQEASAKAEVRIAAMRQEAARHVTIAAQDAAAAIVARLIGDTISPQEAEAAVKGLDA
jgi:F-type H+-transporting ATPase subunit b